MARFFRHMISENVQVFWAALQRGEFITDAAEVVGTYRKQGRAVGDRQWRGAATAGSEPAGALLVFCSGRRSRWPVPAPAADPTPLRSTRTSDSARNRTCCDNCQNPPTPLRTRMGVSKVQR